MFDVCVLDYKSGKPHSPTTINLLFLSLYWLGLELGVGLGFVGQG